MWRRTTSTSLKLKVIQTEFLETRREGTRAYVKADTRSPVFPELRGLIDKT